MLEFRKSPRLSPLAVPVEFLHQQAIHRGLLTNLSEGGAFLSTDLPFPVGDTLGLAIDLAEPFGEIRGQASVAWTSGREGLRFFRLPCGVGLSFVQFSPDGWQRLRRFLDSDARPGRRRQLGPLRPNGERLFSGGANR